jgi:LPS sulfotransferase NodH
MPLSPIRKSRPRSPRSWSKPVGKGMGDFSRARESPRDYGAGYREELERFKTTINLTEYAASQGYQLDKRSSSRSSVVMRHPGGDKVVIARDEDQRWIYCLVRDDADKGSIIDFVQRRCHCTLGDVRRELRLDRRYRRPEYQESYEGLHQVFGEFPQLVNRQMLNEIRRHADAYVEIASSLGLPQPLTSRFSGDRATTGMGISNRPAHMNHYYPSPAMHQQVHDALRGVLEGQDRIIGRSSRKSNPDMIFGRNRIRDLLTRSTRGWMYPNLLSFLGELGPETVVVASTVERIFVQQHAKVRAKVLAFHSFLAAVDKHRTRHILVLAVDDENQKKAHVSDWLRSALGLQIPVLGWFSDILPALSAHSDWRLGRHCLVTHKPIKPYMLLCGPRTGSSMISSLLTRSECFGRPEEHLTLPIVLAIERGVLDPFAWLGMVLEHNVSRNGVFGTKMISDRFLRLLHVDTDQTLLKSFQSFSIVHLYRQDMAAQAVSNFIANQRVNWDHPGAGERLPNATAFESVTYDFGGIYKEYLWLKQQESNVASIIARLEISPAKVLRVAYEDLGEQPARVLERIGDLVGIPTESSWHQLTTNYHRRGTSQKSALLKKFKAELHSSD